MASPNMGLVVKLGPMMSMGMAFSVATIEFSFCCGGMKLPPKMSPSNLKRNLELIKTI